MTTLLATLAQAGAFGTFTSLIEATELKETVSNPGPLTIFAPTDKAFTNFAGKSVDDLRKDIHWLKRVLMYHLAFGDVRSDDLIQIQEIETMEGSIIAVDHANGTTVNDTPITQTDILADNGVIHVIDAVLMPTLLADHPH